jgi:Holliday junction resolvase RusA-like endonuclease
MAERALVFEVTVIGLPAPQGSKTPTGQMFRTKAGGLSPVLRESSKKVKPWRRAVEAACMEITLGTIGWALLDEPLVAEMVFTMPKPKSAPKTVTTYPMRMPDLSKLCRSTEDAMKDGGVYKDDARIIGYDRLYKVYPGEGKDALPFPGAVIRLYRIPQL